MRNTHSALQRWLATGDNSQSSDTGWREGRQQAAEHPRSAAAVIAAAAAAAAAAVAIP
eukprot:COSAG01_NODE_2095_length_8411_cov_3.964611_8_plen_57_part_01